MGEQLNINIHTTGVELPWSNDNEEKNKYDWRYDRKSIN